MVGGLGTSEAQHAGGQRQLERPGALPLGFRFSIPQTSPPSPHPPRSCSTIRRRAIVSRALDGIERVAIGGFQGGAALPEGGLVVAGGTLPRRPDRRSRGSPDFAVTGDGVKVASGTVLDRVRMGATLVALPDVNAMGLGRAGAAVGGQRISNPVSMRSPTPAVERIDLAFGPAASPVQVNATSSRVVSPTTCSRR